MKKTVFVAMVSTMLAVFIFASCSSGASHQAWHPKTGKKPKPGHNR